MEIKDACFEPFGISVPTELQALMMVEYTVTDTELRVALPPVTIEPARCSVIETFSIADEFQSVVKYELSTRELVIFQDDSLSLVGIIPATITVQDAPQ